MYIHSLNNQIKDKFENIPIKCTPFTLFVFVKILQICLFINKHLMYKYDIYKF